MNVPISSRPDPTEYASYYGAYIGLVPEGDILTILQRQIADTVALLHDLSEAEAETRHAPYTWSIKEVVGHLVDSERIFGVRALRFARNDPAALPGFDQDPYIQAAHFDTRPLDSLVQEFDFLRRSHLLFFGGLDGEAWLRSGVASGHPVTVRALAYIIAGHERHHINIVRKRLARPT
jgi:hypothetical protein